MARQDIANMLTGMGGNSNKPNPNMSSADWRMAFGAQQAGAVNRAVSGVSQGMFGSAPMTTPQESIAIGMGNLDLGTIGGLQTLGQMQQMRNDTAGAAKTASQIKKMAVEQNQKLDKEEAQTGFVQFIATNYPSYLGLATTGSITPSNWAAFIKSEKGGDSSPSQFGDSTTFKDEKGNLYFGTQARDPNTENVTSKLSPIGKAPKKPVGRLEQVGAYGQTASERAGSKVSTAVDTEEGKLFVARKDQATTDFGAASEGIIIADKMLTALENISTGGFIPTNIKLATDALGMTPTDVGQFEILAKQQMIQKLSSFGSMPTEGERRVAETLVPAIRNSKGLNAALINSYKEEMQRRAAKSEYLMQPDITIEGFNEFTIQQYKENEDQSKVKNFGDLK